MPTSKRKKRRKAPKHLRLGPQRYSAEDRAAVLAEIDEVLGAEKARDATVALYEDFYGDVHGLPPIGDAEMMEYVEASSHHAFLFWACFDAELPRMPRLVDVMLEEPRRPAGQRAFLQAMRRTRMRIYEIMAVEPGASVTLRDVFVEGDPVKVRERSGSRALQRGELIATRVMRPGASGRPEMDGGSFRFAELQREHALDAVRELLAYLREEEPDRSEDAYWREMPPVLHEQWRTPRIPRPVNYDGDTVTETRVRFDVRDATAVERALDGEASLERQDEGGCWSWKGVGAQRAEDVILGFVQLESDTRLVLATNSVPRGERGRALLESIAGDAIEHRATSHEDLQRKMLESLAEGPSADPGEALDAATREQLRDATERYLAERSAAWPDLEVPALEGKTPRQAARDPALRPKLLELLEMFERTYERALADGSPTADPSWLREELDAPDARRPRDRSRPPPLAHERMAELVPGLDELSGTVAARVRREPGYSPQRAIERHELLEDLGFRRFLREHAPADEAAHEHADPETASNGAEVLASHLEIACNLELHHRKILWVGEGLSWMLGATALDVTGELLELPFGSFALAFTDRYALGLAERMLAREPSCRIRGHLLEVVTAYVTRLREGEGIRVALACDLLDPDWPYLVVRELVVRPEDRLDAILDSHFPDEEGAEVAPIFRCTPLRELLRLVLNAILYATSADAERQALAPSGGSKGARRSEDRPRFTSETVFHLPGTIDIGTLRELKRARRGQTEREQVHRCMVRGHWRRAAKTYKDSRPRWIAPHWRGPSVAATVERQYRLQAPERRSEGGGDP
jgi:hypothetical protein